MYAVSNMGRFLTLPNSKRRKQRIKKTNICGNRGYIRVSIYGRSLSAAKIVAEHFVDNPNNYSFVKYKDKDNKNISASNLYWSNSPNGAVKRVARNYIKPEVDSKSKYDGVFEASKGAWMESDFRKELNRTRKLDKLYEKE